MDVGMVLIASGAVVGTIEWVKRLVPKAPNLVWHLLLLPLCFGVALLLPVGRPSTPGITHQPR